jgi:hypothetical protein
MDVRALKVQIDRASKLGAGVLIGRWDLHARKSLALWSLPIAKSSPLLWFTTTLAPPQIK